eukprot:GHVT01071766.1.p1 GENE.GHVT01071766.1~~GHVT01071766.1.p1  ORF type:complete len:369 (+),score=4.88 GHVT01071766.1:361-1467(+)
MRINWTDGILLKPTDTATIISYPSTTILGLEKYPALRMFFPFAWENNFNAASALEFVTNYFWLAPCVCVLYLLFCYFGQRWMECRSPFDLRKPLKYWNLFLAIFSTIGALRVVPQVILMHVQWGFKCSICFPPVYTFGHGPAAFWMAMFVYSKYFELVDTVFIVLRKRNLSFLHWYHHSTVLLYTSDAFFRELPAGVYFAAMNFSVHAVMYLYYYLASEHRRPPSWGVFVTIGQISQMLLGVAITFISLYYSLTMPFQYEWNSANMTSPKAVAVGHYISVTNLIAACAMYSTYGFLFAKFFITRYIFTGRRDKSSKLAEIAQGKLSDSDTTATSSSLEQSPTRTQPKKKTTSKFAANSTKMRIAPLDH